MTQDEHLDRIIDKCRAHLRLAQERMPGKWTAEGGDYGGIRAPSDHVLLYQGADLHAADADFIAACAGPAEAGWETTITAITALRNQRVRFKLEGFHTGVDTMNKHLSEIIAAWPEDLLS